MNEWMNEWMNASSSKNDKIQPNAIKRKGERVFEFINIRYFLLWFFFSLLLSVLPICGKKIFFLRYLRHFWNIWVVECYDPFGQDKIYETNSLYPKQWCSKGSRSPGSLSTSSTLSGCSKDSKCSRPSSTFNTSNDRRYEGIWRVYIKIRCFLWTSCSIQIIRSQLFLQIYFKQAIRYNYLLFTSRGTVSRNPFKHFNW